MTGFLAPALATKTFCRKVRASGGEVRRGRVFGHHDSLADEDCLDGVVAGGHRGWTEAASVHDACFVDGADRHGAAGTRGVADLDWAEADRRDAAGFRKTVGKIADSAAVRDRP